MPADPTTSPPEIPSMTTSTNAAARPFPYSHCHHCGTPYASAEWPRRCAGCGDLRWHNPTPIGVLLQTVTDGVRVGVLTPVRGHGPQLGCEGLTGGFEEASDDGVDDAATREYREEMHREDDVQRERLDILQSRGSGPMYPPGRRQSLTFSVNPVPVHVDEFRDWVPDAETTAIEFSWEPRVMAFPTHTLALATYFRKYQGVEAPPQYFDQPITGDAVRHEHGRFPVFNVVYEQPLLDDGLWRVQLEQDGGHVTIARDGDEWVAVGTNEGSAPPVMPERSEIEALKRSWLADPHWDLEDSDGFEAVRAELLAFSDVQKAKWERARVERVGARAAELGCSPQLAGYVIALETRLDEVEKALGIKGL
jgi:hypothetical protein